MVVAHKARVSTKDVDAIFAPKDMVYQAAAEVTRECGAAEGWLNDAVKGFLSSKGEIQPLLDLPNLKVFVAVPHTEDMFEPRLFRTLLDFEVVRQYFEDLSIGVEVVEDLNLNTRIWSKE